MGRKSLKIMVESAILDILKDMEIPVTCNYMKKMVSKRTGKDIHFDTVKKYLEDLSKKNLIFKKQLSPSKRTHKRGPILYSRKPFPSKW